MAVNRAEMNNQPELPELRHRRMPQARIPPSGMPDSSRWGFPSGPISDSMHPFGEKPNQNDLFAMAAPIDLRLNSSPILTGLTAAPREEDQGRVTQSRRPALALAEVYDGRRSRTDASRIGGVATGLQIIRDWVLRFNARGPDGLVDGEVTGRTLEAQRRSPPRTGGGC